jgi:hypothetical protein
MAGSREHEQEKYVYNNRQVFSENELDLTNRKLA